MDNNDAVSMSDDRQPFHAINGQTLTQSEWRQKVRLCTDVLEEFKKQAYRDGEI